MVTQINELRVVMDTSSFDAGAAKVEKGAAGAAAAADRLASAVNGVKQADNKFSDAGGWIEKLKGRTIDGYAAMARLNSETGKIARAFELGKLSSDQMSAALDGAIRRAGQMADVSQLVAKGQTEVARAAELANQRFQQQRNIMPANSNLRQANSFNTANIAAQFQDIAVTSAMGMSPIQIALQQGSQLSSVLGEAGAAGAVRSLGAAFLSLVSPVSLATLGLTAAAAWAIQYFSGVNDEASKANDDLQKHADIIGQVAQQWGAAIPAFKGYYDQLKQAQSFQLLQQGKTEIENSYWEQAGQQLDALYPKMLNAQAIMENLGKSADFAKTIQQFSDLQAHVEAHNATAAEAKSLVDLLTNAYDTSGAKAFQGAADYLKQLQHELDVTDQKMGEFTQQLNTAAEVQAKLQTIIQQSTFTDENGQVRSPREFQPRGAISSPKLYYQNTPDGLQPSETEKLANANGSNASEIDKAGAALHRLQISQNDELEKLRLEASLVGASVAERARQTAALQAEQQLRQQGIETLSREGQAYIANAKAMADARTEIERQNAAYQSMQQTGSSMIDSLVTGTGTLEDRLKSVADQLLQWIETMALANPLKNAMFGTNLPTLADLFSGKPQVPGANATTTAMMTVNATTVMLNGAPVGGLPSLPGTNPFAGANATIPSNFTGTSPGLGASAVVRMQAAANQNAPSGDMIADVLAAKNASLTGQPLSFVGKYRTGVDPRLTDILNQAALRTPGYNVQAFSGYRAGDPRFHGQGLATDVRLVDPSTGKILNNYQDPSTFRTYEQFAQNAKLVQMDKYPELNDQFRWGGYFSGGKTRYGAMDEMHFDLGGSKRLGMAGGTWENGLTPAQRNIFPGADSRGFNQLNQSMNRLSTTTTSTIKDIGGLGDTTNKAAGSVTDLLGQNGALSKAITPAAPTQMPSNFFPPAPTTGGFNPLSLFTSIFSLFGFADGTDFAPGGLARINERGAGSEIINLPRGSQVIPAHKVDSYLRGGGSGGSTKVDVGVTVDQNGNLQAYVKKISRSEASGIAADHSAAAVDFYRRNGFAEDMNSYRNAPYERG